MVAKSVEGDSKEKNKYRNVKHIIWIDSIFDERKAVVVELRTSVIQNTLDKKNDGISRPIYGYNKTLEYSYTMAQQQEAF